MSHINIGDLEIVCVDVVYIPAVYFLQFNLYEKELFAGAVGKIIKKIK